MTKSLTPRQRLQWKVLSELDAIKEKLSEWESAFVENCMARMEDRVQITPKQEYFLKRIYSSKIGNISKEFKNVPS